MTETAVYKESLVIIRPGLKKICDGDACRAAVYNQLLYSVSWRLKQGFDYWYGTVKDIWQSIDESWGLSKVIKEVNALVKSGIIGQRRNPVKGFDQTRQYFFGKEQAQALRKLAEKVSVCLQHMGFPSEVSHLLKLTNAFVEKVKCICQNQQMQMLEPTDAFVETDNAIPKDITEDITEDTRDSSSSSEDEIAHRYKRGHAAIQGSHPHQDIISMTSLLTAKDDAFLAEMEKLLDRNQPPTLSTPVIHNVDTESHIAVMPTRKEEEDGNSDPHRNSGNMPGVAPHGILAVRHQATPQGYTSARQIEATRKEGGSHAGVTHVGVPDGHRDSGIAGGEHHSAGVAHTQEVGETDGTNTQYNRDSRGSHPRTDTLLAVPSGGDLHHDTHHQGYLQGAQRGVEAAPPTRETRKRARGGLTLQGQHILDEYQKFKGRKSNPGKATIEAANGLVAMVASDEEFVAVLTEMRDDKFLNEKNVARDLDFVCRKYEKYRDIVEQKQNKTRAPTRDFTSKTLDRERNQRNIDKMNEKVAIIRAERAAKAAMQGGSHAAYQ